MTTFRFKVLEDVLKREPVETTAPSPRISDYFEMNVFNQEMMRRYLPGQIYKQVQEAIESGTVIDRKIADQVASSMKEWALSRGVTHYTHWFQPLTGATAEKHDSFFDPSNGRQIERFDGSLLTQQEPDASSFPSGGIRNTFEARGYTAWDPSSPAFIISKTLCIPTVFISYTGAALDYKMPLMKALHAVDNAAVEVCKYFDKDITKVSATLGWEQEYFLVDKALFNARPDLMMAGRVLFGHTPAKGQQLDDHYFGSIPERAVAFMRDFETESLKLGIPVTTRHNEVAPNQFECAPMFEETNLAVDHNSLLMDIMEKVARRHNFRVLLHEKPFSGVNGSGKHNNWSLATNTGVNLLSPGKNPKSNLMFLTFFINTIKAIYDYADILRASIASAGNDHRLGANEAPPAIISTFIGTQLTQVLNDLEENVKSGKMSPEAKTNLKLNIGRIPEILLDNTDRNRTSPFAFTGNKFEFRAVGSSANCSNSMTALNSIVAMQLRKFKIEVDKQIEKDGNKDVAIFKVLRDCIVASKNVRFEGDGYGDAWLKEAKKRGLSNITDTPRALDAMISKQAKDLYSGLNVLTPLELEARHTIELEKYTMIIQIESRLCGDIALNHILPTAFRYQTILIENAKGLMDVLGASEGKKAAKTQLEMIREISSHIEKIKGLCDAMLEERKKANKINDDRSRAIAYCDKVRPYLDKVRYHADKLETMVDDALWPLPKIRELLFTK